MPNADHPILDYASPPRMDAIAFLLSRMRLCRTIAISGLALAIAGSISIPFVAILGLALFVGATILTWICMTRAAARQFGAGAALGYLILAIILTPILSIFLVPGMLDSDVMQRRGR